MNNELVLSTGEHISVEVFRPGDAEGLTRLFRAVYGEGYPVRTVYDPGLLIAAFEKRENVPVIARNVKGDIVGTVSLCRTTPNPGVYEGGQGLVLPSYRGLGISEAVNRYLMEVVARDLDVEAVFGEAVCNHVFMQKTTANVGYVDTGLEVDLMPAEAYVAGGRSSGRVSTLTQFRLYKPGSTVVYLPAMYEEWLRFLYEGFDDDRTFVVSRPSEEPTGMSEVKAQVFDFARVARVAVHHAGADFGAVFEANEEEFLFNGMLVIQVWLPLSVPSIAAAVQELASRKYFFGGLLLRWFGNDALLMQRVVGRPNWEGIILYLERTKRIRDMVYQDWERTAR